MSNKARVFISYARKDGENFATHLRQRLEQTEPEISLWQDRAQMEGGRDWWLQITNALDQVQFFVLCMTPAAMSSQMVRQEWRYARSRGACIYPVKAAPDQQLDFSRLPGWMQRDHFFDLDKEWNTFVNYLKSPCRAVRVPFLCDELPDGYVSRTGELGQLMRAMLDQTRSDVVVGMTALVGSGGFGKTTLALELCHQDVVLTACDGGILWVTLGEQPNLVAELKKLYAAFTGERPEFVDVEDAAYQLSTKLADRHCLLVLDDVWDYDHVKPFHRAAKQSAVIITTRLLEVAGEAEERVEVGEMQPAEAAQMLASRLQPTAVDMQPFRDLAVRLGEWPLLMDLANATLRLRVQQGDSVAGALVYLNRALDKRGVVAFDRRDAKQRNDAVAKTIEVSLEGLTAAEQGRCLSLGIFPPDQPIPVSVLEILWELDDLDTDEAVQLLAGRSLLKHRIATGTVEVHDTTLAYLGTRLDNTRPLHARLADAWSDASSPAAQQDYAQGYVAYHLAEAMQGAEQDEVLVRGRQLLKHLVDAGYQEYQDTRGDPAFLQAQLRRALQELVGVTGRHAALVASGVAYGLSSSYAEPPDPQLIFDLASRGEIVAAEERLSLFPANGFWQRIALLLIAWLGQHRKDSAAAAGRLRDRLAAEATEAPLDLVLRWVDAGKDDVPVGIEASPNRPDLFQINQLLQRLSGAGDAEGLEPLNLNISGLAPGDEEPMFLAQLDGPMLVEFAAQNPEHHTQYLEQYIALHSANPYGYYRNRSLQELAKHVVKFPEAGWVRDRLVQLCTGALTQTRVHFRAAVPTVLLALRVRAGEAGALAEWESYVSQVKQEAASLEPLRGKSDTWGHCLRRLASLAEVTALVLDDRPEALALAQMAQHLPFGYAGFWAPACLSLAETWRMIQPQDRRAIDEILEASIRSANNVQEPSFCALTTAITQTMTEQWWPVAVYDAAQLESLVARLEREPRTAEFQPLHKIGETYPMRSPGPHMLLLPPEMFSADSLGAVAAVYGCSVEDILQLNHAQGWGVDDQLEAGDKAALPYADFAPLLAARLAAECAMVDGLGRGQRAGLMARLLPVAVSNPTALDVLISRLLLVAGRVDENSLRMLEALTAPRAAQMTTAESSPIFTNRSVP